VEEEILYPALRATGDPKLTCLVRESLREHARVKKLVASLRRRPDGGDLDERVASLEECVEHHVNEEERDMLPRVGELVDRTERMALGRRMQQRKRGLAGRAGRQVARPAGRPAPRKVRRAG
jgi:hypothetical protein